MKSSARRRGFWLAVAVVLVLAGLGGFAGAAGAVIVKLADGRSVSYLPPTAMSPLAAPFARSLSDSGTARVTYHGGPVMPSSANYLFLWAPHGLSSYPTGYVEGVERFFRDLVHDAGGRANVESVLTQYGDSEGKAASYAMSFGGVLVDEAAYPANGCRAATTCLTEAQLAAGLKTYVAKNALPTGTQDAYFILTPPEIESCFESNSRECSAGSSAPAYCAFHGYTEVSGSPLIFGVDPYAVGVEGCDTGKHPSGLAAEGEIQAGLSHEHAEMLTDPEINAWYGSSGEVGDLCRTFESASEFGTPLGTATDGSAYNQLINGDEYYYQQEWSNEISGCAQRQGSTATIVRALFPRTGPAAGGTTVLIKGSGMTGVSAVSFAGRPAASYRVLNSTEIEAVTPAGTSGAATVMVVGEAGASNSLTFKYGSPTVSGVEPASGPLAGGNSVTIRGSGFEPGSTTVIRFGSKLATSVSCATATTCTADAPAGAAGTVDVRATAGGKSSARVIASDGYTYR